tara:strand:+ start:6053 stop:6352 length:300 start_codon:yes stop_codon:yes gene_type:complete
MLIPCYCCGNSFPVFSRDQPDDQNFVGIYEGHNDGEDCRAIVICRACMDKGDFDMWTDEAEWNSKSPVVAFNKLPPYDHNGPDRDDVTKYPTPEELVAA